MAPWKQQILPSNPFLRSCLDKKVVTSSVWRSSEQTCHWCYGFKVSFFQLSVECIPKVPLEQFILQADDPISSPRPAGSTFWWKEWNRALLRVVIEVFVLTVERFADHPTLRNVWFRYLPESISDFFTSSMN